MSKNLASKKNEMVKKMLVKHDRSTGLKFSRSHGARDGKPSVSFRGHTVTNQPKGNLFSPANSYGK